MMKNRPSDCPSDFNIGLAKSDGGPGGQESGQVIAVVGDAWGVRTVVGRAENGTFDPSRADTVNGLVCTVDSTFPDSEQPQPRVKGNGRGQAEPATVADRISNATDVGVTNLTLNSVVAERDLRHQHHHPSLCNGSSSNGTLPTAVRRISRSASLGSDQGSETDDWQRACRRGDADGACDPAAPDHHHQHPPVQQISSDNGGGGVRRSSMPDTCVAGSTPDVGTAPYSLSAVMESIPLAYDPRTRQLRLISVNSACTRSDTDDGNNNKSLASMTDYPATADTSRLRPGTPGDGNDAATGAGCERTSPAEVQLRSKSKSESSSSVAVGRHSSESVGGESGTFLGFLQRVPTTGSLQSRAECCSSVSSISSLSTDVSFSATSSVFNDDGCGGSGAGHEVPPVGGGRSGNAYLLLDSDEAGFIEINLEQRHHGRNEHHYQPPPASGSPDSASGLQSADEESGDGGATKNKRRGLSGLLNRSLLPWKSTRTPNLAEDADAPGWKLFGKTPPRHTAGRDPNKIIEEYHPADGAVEQSSLSAELNQARQRQLSSEQTASANNTTPKSKKGNGLVASSTTALILENRPLNLPAKDPDEELKHRLEYEQMVEFAKKREIKEAKQKKKRMQQQLKHEEQLFLASKVWNAEILPNWETTKQSRRTKELWWQGIPPCVRGKVWKLAIGNDLHITPELYEICVCRAKDRIRMAAEMISVSEEDCNEEGLADKEGSVELIKLDVSRSFPQLCIFQKGGPYYDMLHSLLGAYVCYRPDVGYVQGMSFLAAVLILNLEVADAFICFANLLNQPCQLAFFRLDEPMMRSYFSTYEEFFKENMPKLFSHFGKQSLSADLYLIDWIYTLYSRSLPLDVASRVWDVFFRDGDEFLFRTALGILRLYEDILLQLDFIHLAQFLTKLPENIAPEPLFKSIESVKMVCDKHTFAQVLLHHSEARTT